MSDVREFFFLTKKLTLLQQMLQILQLNDMQSESRRIKCNIA